MTYDPNERITLESSLKNPWLWSFDNQTGEEEENSRLKYSLDKILHFKPLTKMEELIYRFCVQYMMGSEDKKHALSSFQLVDQNLDGTICLEELKRILSKRGVL